MLAGLDDVLCGGSGILRMAGKYLVLDRYPPHFKDYVGLEQSTLSLFSYETFMIHGLFQTEEYAHALIGGGFPPLPEEKVEQLVEARMDRKALFDREPTAVVELVLDEGALRRDFGGPEVMRRQYAYLAECAQRRNVTLQVMPLNRGLRGEHAGAHGPLNLVKSPEHRQLAYTESQGTSLLISDPGEATLLDQRYAMIRAQALSPDESLSLIERLKGEQ
jgi:hypothetical protein